MSTIPCRPSTPRKESIQSDSFDDDLYGMMLSQNSQPNYDAGDIHPDDDTEYDSSSDSTYDFSETSSSSSEYEADQDSSSWSDSSDSSDHDKLDKYWDWTSNQFYYNHEYDNMCNDMRNEQSHIYDETTDEDTAEQVEDKNATAAGYPGAESYDLATSQTYYDRQNEPRGEPQNEPIDGATIGTISVYVSCAVAVVTSIFCMIVTKMGQSGTQN